MNKRQFISNSLSVFLGAAAGSLQAAESTPHSQSDGQVILTVTGAIQRANRGKFDVMMDQLMHKQGVHFDRAWQFSLAELEKLPVAIIRPTMEYDAQVHELSGPRLIDVLNAAGLSKAGVSKIVFHGIDGYSPEIDLELAKKFNYVVATRIDGKLLHVGGFGPLFALYDADRIPELAQKPLSQRFAQCPWGLYCIEVL